MIGKIKGTVDTISEDSVIVDVGGVGYILFCTTNTLSQLTIGGYAAFYTHMVVKEDQLTLFGFLSEEEKHWFNILQTVQGVGPKMALGVLSGMHIEDISAAIVSEDQNAFKKVSGVGPKLSARIVNELKGKKGILEGVAKIQMSGTKQPANSNKFADAVSALTNLGFQRKDVFVLVSEIHAANENISLEETIKVALSKLMSG